MTRNIETPLRCVSTTNYILCGDYKWLPFSDCVCVCVFRCCLFARFMISFMNMVSSTRLVSAFYGVPPPSPSPPLFSFSFPNDTYMFIWSRIIGKSVLLFLIDHASTWFDHTFHLIKILEFAFEPFFIMKNTHKHT